MFTIGVFSEESHLSKKDNGRNRNSKLERELQCGTSFVKFLEVVKLSPVEVDANQSY